MGSRGTQRLVKESGIVQKNEYQKYRSIKCDVSRSLLLQLSLTQLTSPAPYTPKLCAEEHRKDHTKTHAHRQVIKS